MAQRSKLQRGQRAEKSRNVGFALKELDLAGDALSDMMLGEYDQPDYDPDIREIMLCSKSAKKPIPAYMLSQGLQPAFLTIVDLLRRAAASNRFAGGKPDKMLQTTDLVLRDETDLHFYPTWQQKILPALFGAFPKCSVYSCGSQSAGAGICHA